VAEELDKEREVDTCICCEDFWEYLFESLSNSAKEVASTGFYWLIEVPFGITSDLLSLFETLYL